VLNIYRYATESEALQRKLERSVDFDPSVEKAVHDILQTVRTGGDRAVFDFTEQFQGVRLKDFMVSPEEIRMAYEHADPAFIAVLEEAYRNITAFHRHEIEKSFFYEDEGGVILGQRVTPMDRAMLYVPGGKAAYPSSLLMNAAPAQVAGVREIFLTTPCDRDGNVSAHILAAAAVAGIERVCKLGGAQAVAAFAYGTESIPRTGRTRSGCIRSAHHPLGTARARG